MSLIELKIERIQYSETQTGAYVLFLYEPVSNKKLPIIIGGMEAHAITIGLEKDIIPQRPLTHDLMKNLMDSYYINLKRVIINKFDQGIFYSLLVTEKDGIEISIDSRTSDAVAMAVRFNAPVFCESSILEEAGIYLPDVSDLKNQLDEQMDIEKGELSEIGKLIEEIESEIINKIEETEDGKVENLSDIEKLTVELFGTKRLKYSKSDLKKMLKIAIEDEEYEKAAKLKELIELLN
jgi:bifunctional DNase/RNase